MAPEGSAFETLIGELSARFVGIAPARFDEEIGQTLRTVVEWFGTDRASFMEFSADLTTLVSTHAWAKPSAVEPHPPHAIWQSLPWYFQQLQRGYAPRARQGFRVSFGDQRFRPVRRDFEGRRETRASDSLAPSRSRASAAIRCSCTDSAG